MYKKISKLCTVSLFIVSLFLGSQAHAAQVVTNDWAKITLRSLEGIFSSPSNFEVLLEDINPPSNSQIYYIVYSIGIKEYPDQFTDESIDNITYPHLAEDQNYNGSGNLFKEDIPLVSGSQRIYLWASRENKPNQFQPQPPFSTWTYKYVGYVTINNFGQRDYNIQLESDTNATNIQYPLAVRVDNNPYAYTDLYYTLNTLDQTQKVKMSQVGISNKYIASPNVRLNVGENKITVYVADKNGTIVSGSNAVKLFTINAAEPEQRELESLIIYDGQDTMTVGGTKIRLRAKGVYSNGDEEEITGSVTWKSSNSGILLVSGNGTAKAISPGTAVITATLEEEYEFNQNARATKTITVLAQGENPVDDDVQADDEDQVLVEEGQGDEQEEQSQEDARQQEEARQREMELQEKEKQLAVEQAALEERLKEIELLLAVEQNDGNNLDNSQQEKLQQEELQQEKQQLLAVLSQVEEQKQEVIESKKEVENILDSDDKEKTGFLKNIINKFWWILLVIAAFAIGFASRQKYKKIK